MTVRLNSPADGKRIDVVLAELMPEFSRNAVQKLLENGKVRLSGTVVKKNAKPCEGEQIEVEVPEPEPLNAEPENIPLDVRFEDEWVIVVNKPKGMVVHPAPGHSNGTLVNALLYRCGDTLSGIGGVERPGIVHRIDKDTSGLIIIAKNDDAHRCLSSQLKDHTLSRTYDAVVRGGMRDDCGVVNAPIGRSPSDRKKQCVTERNSREAVTHWTVAERFDGYTHIRCELETGRTHQIRVHMAYIGHPIIGDTVYGSRKSEFGLDGQCLHASKLRFVHPNTGETIEVVSELPEYFVKVLKTLSKHPV